MRVQIWAQTTTTKGFVWATVSPHRRTLISTVRDPKERIIRAFGITPQYHALQVWVSRELTGDHLYAYLIPQEPNDAPSPTKTARK